MKCRRCGYYLPAFFNVSTCPKCGHTFAEEIFAGKIKRGKGDRIGSAVSPRQGPALRLSKRKKLL